MKSSRLILLLSSTLLLAGCGEATPEPSSSSATPDISSSDTPAPEPSSSSRSSGSGEKEDSSSSSKEDQEILNAKEIRKAQKALGDAIDAMKETDAIGVSSSGGSGSLTLKTGDKTITLPSSDSSSEEDHSFSGTARFSYSDLTVAGGIQGTKSSDLSTMKGFLAMGCSITYSVAAEVDGESQNKSGTAAETGFVYLQDDHLYLDGSGLKDTDGETLLSTPKVQYCVSETLDYLKEKAEEVQSSLSSSFAFPSFSYDASSMSGASMVASLGLISDKKTYYSLSNGDYRADYVLSYDSIYALLQAMGEKKDEVANVVSSLPKPDQVDLEKSLLQFVYNASDIKTVSTDFAATVQESDYTATLASSSTYALTTGESVAILEVSDPSSYVDKTPKSESGEAK